MCVVFSIQVQIHYLLCTSSSYNILCSVASLPYIHLYIYITHSLSFILSYVYTHLYIDCLLLSSFLFFSFLCLFDITIKKYAIFFDLWAYLKKRRSKPCVTCVSTGNRSNFLLFLFRCSLFTSGPILLAKFRRSIELASWHIYHQQYNPCYHT